MRYTTTLENNHSNLKRLMIYDTGKGTYLFGYDTLQDAPSLWDAWFETLQEAKQSAQTYSNTPLEWQEIPDPQKGCQHDWIAPVRINQKDNGQTSQPRFEKLEEGQWVEV